MRWEWIPAYFPLLMHGLWLTVQLTILSVSIGFILAVPIGLVQVTGPSYLARPARWFCVFIRGTPLLIQLWLLYYGLGDYLPYLKFTKTICIGQSCVWDILANGYYYGLLALILSFAGYEGEVMRGAFQGVPRGELEAARAFGMSPWKVLSRVWFPRAVRQVLPTLAGETVLQLKSTPVVFTVTVLDLMGVASKVRQDLYITYEPLLFVAAIYICLTLLIVLAFRFVESLVPQKR